MSPFRLPRLLPLALALGAAAPAAAVLAKDKDKAKPPPFAKPGFQKLDLAPTYVYVSVPPTFDPKKFYPCLWILHSISENAAVATKPEDFVNAWAETTLKDSWVLAGRFSAIYDNEETIKPLMDALALVKATCHVDERRVVVAGHNAGASMAWRLFTRESASFAAIVSFSAEIPDADRSALKSLAGKPAYVFWGAKDPTYNAASVDRDKKFLDFAKVATTFKVLPGWGVDYPRQAMPDIVTWVDAVWPPGTYREKAEAAKAALASKDLAAAFAALTELAAYLKKSPYPAFEARRQAMEKDFLEQGREKIGAAKRLLDGGQPLDAVDAAEAALKALKGLHPLDAEAASALAALKKEPAVVAAVKKKEAEASAVSLFEKAAAAEAKGDLARALELYKKVVALGETSKKAAAEAKVAALEPQVPPK